MAGGLPSSCIPRTSLAHASVKFNRDRDDIRLFKESQGESPRLFDIALSLLVVPCVPSLASICPKNDLMRCVCSSFMVTSKSWTIGDLLRQADQPTFAQTRVWFRPAGRHTHRQVKCASMYFNFAWSTQPQQTRGLNHKPRYRR